jgi:hypothetical protein
VKTARGHNKERRSDARLTIANSTACRRISTDRSSFGLNWKSNRRRSRRRSAPVARIGAVVLLLLLTPWLLCVAGAVTAGIAGLSRVSVRSVGL